MAKLSAAARRKLPKGSFATPGCSERALEVAMPAGRLAAYACLMLWLGSLTFAWTSNLMDDNALGVWTTSGLGLALVAVLAVMARRDYRRGRITP